jgi:hypothetical protein
MEPEDAQKLLDQANAKIRDRITLHLTVWRWLIGSCLQCGNPMKIYWGPIGDVRACTVYPNHKSYATRWRIIFRPWILIVLIVAIIAVRSYGKTAKPKAPPLEVSKDTFMTPYYKNK